MKTTLQLNDASVTLEAVEKKPHEVRFEMAGKRYHFFGHRLADGGFALDEEIMPGVWRRVGGSLWPAGKGTFRIELGAREAKISPVLPGVAASPASRLSPVAPMPGLVRQVLVKAGDKVTDGQPLVVMEAMKLQTTLAAGGDGIVEAVLVKAGELVAEGAELVRLAAAKKG